ncbi:DUF1697 domain-containing protein [Chitinophagaceae bacterium MMS25-I14]
MTRYIAFLRAVNVGGRVVKMEELKKIFALPGISNISTYIQSGNVLFDSKADIAALKKKLETALFKALDYEVTVFIKTVPELEQIINNNPFAGKAEGKTLYISLLSATPDAPGIVALEQLKQKDEDLAIISTEAYILCPEKTYGNSKLSNVSVEKKLKVQATTRNITTMNKLLALTAK